MNDLAKLTRECDIGVITINNPPVNALSPGVPEGIESAIQTCCEDPSVMAMILIGAGHTFIAGADIKEFKKIASGEKPFDGAMFRLFPTIENCSKPIIAAIHGTALGGGLETALSCHYRVAVASAQVGQPEVKLGLIPNAGGTQRLPRLTGMAKAAEMCAGGELVSAAEAARIGILDQLVDGDLLQGAIAFARQVIANGGLPCKTRDREIPPCDPQAMSAIKHAFAKRARGLVAPQKAIEAVEAASLPFEEGIQREAELFSECLFSEQSKALIHVFLGEREVSKIPGIGKEVSKFPIRLSKEWNSRSRYLPNSTKSLAPMQSSRRTLRRSISTRSRQQPVALSKSSGTISLAQQISCGFSRSCEVRRRALK